MSANEIHWDRADALWWYCSRSRSTKGRPVDPVVTHKTQMQAGMVSFPAAIFRACENRQPYTSQRGHRGQERLFILTKKANAQLAVEKQPRRYTACKAAWKRYNEQHEADANAM